VKEERRETTGWRDTREKKEDRYNRREGYK
jgi:hypothetical protein